MTPYIPLPSVVGGPEIEDLCEIAVAAPPGCFVEFGVYKGGTASHLAQIARLQGRPIYLYDTFTGIPFKSEFDDHCPGDFSDTSYEAVRSAIPDAIFGVGVFPDTLMEMPPIAFVHVDADQYQSLKDAIRVFTPLMAPGASMVFDDYRCLAGADKAIAEWEVELGHPIATTRRGKGLWVKS
jgi:O-methyltransferase